MGEEKRTWCIVSVVLSALIDCFELVALYCILQVKNKERPGSQVVSHEEEIYNL